MHKYFILLSFIISLEVCAGLTHSKILFSNVDYSNQRWTSLFSHRTSNIQNLIDHLKRSEFGIKLLATARIKARKKNISLVTLITDAEQSYTDTTLVRRYDERNLLNVKYQTNETIYINRNHSVAQAVLDLAHELTHFCYKQQFNPYRDHLTVVDYIRHVIESKGGEVSAFINECRIGNELFLTKGKTDIHCKNYLSMAARVGRQYLTRIFYQLGEYNTQFHRRMLEKWSLSKPFYGNLNKDIHFVSAVHGFPYPLAALVEYEEIISRSCEFEGQRLFKLSQLSESDFNSRKIWTVLKDKYITRCSNFSL
ncbi:ImmA/IrrE family metallo-endopeptidase [Bacteriovoracaceae bacterium]|nr:ImmA/IrrE family metallo-endopeptidase [Bacteriovoracaceae bacterium]